MKEGKELFYVCLYKDGESLIGHACSSENSFEDSIENQNSKLKESNKNKNELNESNNLNIFNLYCDSIISYIDILPLIASLTPTLTYGIRSGGLVKFLNSRSLRSEDSSNRIVFDIPMKYFSEFNDISNAVGRAQSVGRQIPKMLIIGIVSSYEHHLSLIIREILKNNPAKLSASEKQFSVREVFDAGDIESFKQQVLDKEIDTIMRGSFEEQVLWIEKAIGIKNEIKADYGDWPKLVEIFERRNLFTHTNGIVNDRYISKAKKLNFSQKDSLKKGQELLAGPKYFKAALEIFCDFGVKMIQVCWRKIEKNNEKIADDALTSFGFELIERGRYSLAIKIFEFFFSLNSKRDEESRLTSVVNLANAYRLSGDIKKAEKILSQEDWSVVNDNFRISVAAVRDDCAEVVRLMKRMGSDFDFGERSYEEWPVFFHVRDQDSFKDTFKIVFGREYSPAPKKRRGILELMKLEDDLNPGYDSKVKLPQGKSRRKSPQLDKGNEN